MGDVLDLVHRLRKAEEHRARAILASSETKVSESQALLASTEARLAESYSASSEASANGVMHLQALHQGALRLEVQRRMQSRDLTASEDEASQARAAFSDKARQAKVVELVADARRDAHLHQHQRRTRAAFDEQGLQSWWRHSA